jgi:hypothetical protein
MPTDGPAQQRDITSREVDSTPLTIADVFPEIEIVVEAGVPPYKMKGDPQEGTDCAVAGDREVRDLLEETDCSQFLRASFSSYNDQYYVTVGVLNLLDLPSARAFFDELKALTDPSNIDYRGSLRGYSTDATVNGIFRDAAPQLMFDVRGHFLLYAVVVHQNGAPMTEDDKGALDTIQDDMLRIYLRNTVLARWATVTAAATESTTESGSPSAPASPTA